MTRIESFGWRGEVVAGIGRVVSAHGDYYHLVCNEADGEILARKKKSAFAKRVESVTEAGGMRHVRRGEIGEEVLVPITGDFVRFRYNAQGESMITDILPRFSHFERRDANARRKSQTLAVNFDTLFIMMALNADFSTARLDRYLTLSEDMGEAEAVVVLTKRDLVPPSEAEELRAEADRLASRLSRRCLAISSLTGEGMDGVMEYVKPGRTLAFVGSSGVGKSTLLNVLAGEEWAATQEIQEWSGKGRHTTTSRELAMLPSGAMVVDTPGIREIGMLGETDVMHAKGESTHRWRK